MLIVDTLLYLLLTWYIEEVYTGKYGVAKPLYFPFMPSYWLGQRGRGMCLKKRGAHHVRLEEEGVEEEEQDGVELIGGWKLTYIPRVHIISARTVHPY